MESTIGETPRNIPFHPILTISIIRIHTVQSVQNAEYFREIVNYHETLIRFNPDVNNFRKLLNLSNVQGGSYTGGTGGTNGLNGANGWLGH